MRVTKNYTTDGGDRTVIGGVLEFAGGKIVKDGEEVSVGGGSAAPGSVTHEMLAEKAVRSVNIGTGSVMPEHLNSSIESRFRGMEEEIKELQSKLSKE
ncbi:hypothetical protein [Bacillus safensis]|uniref:hypothetical protein n=1 Tax=Bacillus safensis TaxID=561879 RepID=UPI000BA5B4A4|nr:hypothetical protein [Bacillus safensis]OYN65444.1 hypothetical protein CFH85_12405 [Bacillus safensis]